MTIKPNGKPVCKHCPSHEMKKRIAFLESMLDGNSPTTNNFVELVEYQFTTGASVRDAFQALRKTHPYTTKAMIQFWYGRFDQENTKT